METPINLASDKHIKTRELNARGYFHLGFIEKHLRVLETLTKNNINIIITNDKKGNSRLILMSFLFYCLY